MRSPWLALCTVLIVAAAGSPARAQATPGGSGTESVTEALCRLIEGAARTRALPVDFLTRLIWQESSFRADVTSRAGAQGVAQFMPGTAAERGLLDPFDPEQAIPESARLLSDLRRRFGNLGLAAAAYNAGPGRVAKWMAGEGEMWAETRRYVLTITGRPIEDWAAEARGGGGERGGGEGGAAPAPDAADARSCLQLAAALRRPGREGAPVVAEAPLAPWGVQLAGNFSKPVALASFQRARQAHAKVIGDARPMVIGTRLKSRGTRVFYRVRVPAQTREAANGLCERIRAAGGACVVLPS